MGTIHLVQTDFISNYRRLNSEAPQYDDWIGGYDCAFPSSEMARAFAIRFLKQHFEYLGNDWKLEYADYETQISVLYNGGEVAFATIAAYDYTTKLAEVI